VRGGGGQEAAHRSSAACLCRCPIRKLRLSLMCRRSSQIAAWAIRECQADYFMARFTLRRPRRLGLLHYSHWCCWARLRVRRSTTSRLRWPHGIGSVKRRGRSRIRVEERSCSGPEQLPYKLFLQLGNDICRTKLVRRPFSFISQARSCHFVPDRGTVYEKQIDPFACHDMPKPVVPADLGIGPMPNSGHLGAEPGWRLPS
jgi:hypothetical protein